MGGEDREQRFLEDLAGRLDAALGAGETKTFILVAPPKALGMLRAACSAHVKAAIRSEVDKDYVNMPVHEIEKHLAG
jgi:protein required for attachment to host cells